MLLLKLFSVAVSALPWRMGQRLGALLGLTWYYLLPIRRRTVRRNLALGLPNRTDHRTVARECYRHLGISFVELLKSAHMSTDDIITHIHPHGMPRYRNALAKGRGVIVVTAHFGNFDLLAVSQAAQGIPLAIVSRNLHQSGINQFWMETRKRSGLTIFPDRGAAKNVLKWLRKGGVVGLTADQRTGPKNGGIRINFLGQPAWTTTAPAALAMASGASLLPVRLERRPDGDHDLYIGEEIPLPNRRSGDSIQKVAESYNKIIELWITKGPNQWMWLHKRFKDYEEGIHT